MNQASVNKQAETTPAHITLGSALNDKQIPVEHPVLQKPMTSEMPLIPILRTNQMSVEQNTVKPNPMTQISDVPIPPSFTVVEKIEKEVLQKYALPPMDESQGNASPKPLNMLIDEGFREAQLNYNQNEITENETINDPNRLIESVGNNFDVDSHELPPVVKNTQISKRAINSQPTGFAGSARVADPRWLVTLRYTRLILIYKGYHYRRYYCQGSKIKWHCVDYECCAYLYSCVNKITVIHSIHNHMGIIRKNNTPEKITEPEAVSSSEKLTMTNPVPAIDQGPDPCILVASNVKTTSLVYTDKSIFSGKTATQTSPSQSENLVPSRSPHVLCSGNTIIPRNPSLEIPVNYSSDFSENDNTIQVGSENTVTELLNPVDFCVTIYNNPISPKSSATLGNSQNSKNKYMSVPKDVQAEVTIKSIPSVSKPQVYYDGKLAQPAIDQRKYSNEFTPTASCTISSSNTVSNNILTANDIFTGAHASEDNNSLNNNDGSEVPYVESHTNNQENRCNILRRALSGNNLRNLQHALIPRARASRKKERK